ncbi:hypothetical protein DPMN_057309 [Dreissena polymorpha]|uniref:Uncharacterized protein n=1 Tax=Dreissena polymorpha TaxID=45954 RepID=A0A9D4BZW4_DREPO|nr:hypothetical protein DPMN_057309 [Dreissena polymorpha]
MTVCILKDPAFRFRDAGRPGIVHAAELSKARQTTCIKLFDPTFVLRFRTVCVLSHKKINLRKIYLRYTMFNSGV